ncbi:TonB-dependent receptor [Dysgonomonas sp. 25]|uniref:SusC/RagA family TonB-linked outer membrane protein n=1 Tax=Dysgonomonas sp. 25 TaxID=2302933 RepID=UPI002104520B|nr:TonB-dependent receptor [Dysgonomonas sp. 25]
MCFLLTPSLAFAYPSNPGIDGVEIVNEDIEVSGTVLDEFGEPLIGVTVSVRGTTSAATQTDIDGKYTLKVPSGSSLRFSYVGYQTVEEPVNGRSVINVKFMKSSSELEEVIVVGYGTQKKESITGAISAIGGDDLMTTNASTTSTALAGKIVGLNNRMTNGRPGSTTSINIRNMGTPLFVIDGIQTDEGQFNNIDANDIESISILKDASAAIYGLRAANGVVVVKTKSGRKNTKNTINVNANYGWQTWSRFPKPADTETYVKAKYQSDVIRKSNDPGYTMTYTPADLDKWQQGTDPDYRGFDWYDYIIKTSPQSYIGANMSGGTDKATYYLALSNTNQEATIRNYGDFDRTNMQMNLNVDITEKFRVGGQINGRIEKRRRPGVPGGDDYWTAMFAIYRNLPTKRPFANDNPDYPARTADRTDVNFGMLNFDKSGTYKEKWRVVQMNLDAEYKIIDGLSIKALGGYYFADFELANHEYTYKLYDYDKATDTYSVNYEMSNPYMERKYEKVEEMNGQLLIDFNRQFGDHKIAAVAGGEFKSHQRPNFWIRDRPTANSIDNIYLTTVAEINDNLASKETRAGFIGRVNYDFANKYLAEFIFRYDGSWKFPKDDRWGFFPSVSLGWRVSEEDFWKPLKETVNDFKPKFSYGIVGNDTFDGYSAYDFLGGYTYNDGGAVLDGKWVIGSKARGIPVKTLSWLEAKMMNVGFDATFLDHRLTAEFNYFTRKLDGLPADKWDVLVPTEAGFSPPRENLNSEMLKGFEGSLTWKDTWKDLNYRIGGNFTFSRKYNWHQYKPRHGNSWKEYRDSRNERYADIAWGYQVIGQFKNWEQIANYPVDIDGKGNSTMRPGDFIYKDTNGDGTINGMDERPIGYRQGALPYMNFNFNFDFEYKGIDLSMTWGGSTYASYLMQWEIQRPLHDGGNSPQFMLGNQWHLADIHDANSEYLPGKYPMALSGNSDHMNYRTNDFWLKNVNYLKLRNLEIGYSLPKKILNPIGIERFRVYTSMQNLFSIDNMHDIDIDPELSKDSAIEYPTTRVISIGFNLTF